MITHMLEHFHRDHAVVGLIGLVSINICSDYLEVVQPTLFCRFHNILPLRVGIRHGADTGIGEVLCHPQREGAPTAAKLQHILPVL